jgi:fructokinase
MTTIKKLKAVAFGEVLWDVFTDKKKLGGAPLNVASRMKSLGCEGTIISSVGNDTDGEALLKEVEKLGLGTDFILKSGHYPTGVVHVTLDQNGAATYKINYPSAWDKIVLNDFIKEKVKKSDVLIHGSLICRDEVSYQALKELLNIEVYKVFDVNLRKPHYSYALLEQLMQTADFIKFNDDELLEIATALGSDFKTLEENIQFIAQKTNTSSICVTLGEDGALLFWENNLYSNTGYAVKVADTVGAGDSFLGSLITLLLSGETPQKSLDFACAMGALVAQSHGANPEISLEQIESFITK